MKLILVLFLLMGSGVTSEASYRLVHYNIRELDSTKIRLGQRNKQVKAASEILKSLNGDIISINEIQYDLKSVPNSEYQTEGKNLELLSKLLGANGFHSIFAPANTGLKAKKLRSGNYTTNPNHPDWMELADHENFGLFPAQYSTGALSQFPVLTQVVINSLKWTDFNPNFDPSQFKMANGKPYPKDLPLFDKNFTDTTLQIGDQKVHLLLLHTVPAFNFGNPDGLNLERNADQLAFLKYYLTGKSPYKSQNLPQALEKNTTFIATGDWNVEKTKEGSPGATTLRELGKEFRFWTDKDEITYQSQTFAPNPFQMQLDYILLSHDILIKSAGVFRPDDYRKELGCLLLPPPPSQDEYEVVSYRNGEDTCYVEVKKALVQAKTASDHFPIFLDFELKGAKNK